MEKKLIDIVALGLYNEKIKGLLAEKQDKGEYEAAGAAEQALADAKAYADAEIEKLSFDGAGTAKTLADAAEKNAKDYADGLAVNYDAAGAADAAEKNAKDYADGKFQEKGNFETAGAAAQALADAKADAAEKYQVKGNYEVAGTAAGLNEAMDARMQAVEGREVFVSATVNQAIADAKAAAIADAAEKYQVKGDYEVAGAAAQALEAAKGYTDDEIAKLSFDEAGTAAGLNAAMDARVAKLEAIDHDQLAKDAAASAVSTIIDGASDSFDTLKEVADWIANNEHAEDVATLVTDVENLKKIDHEAYKAADEQVLAAAKADAASLYQVKIEDLATIREGAALGATAVQSLAGYATEDFVTSQGYITATDLLFAEESDIDALFA